MGGCLFEMDIKMDWDEDASKNGVARETINNVRRSSKAMTEQEARQILGLSEQASWEEVLQKYDALFERNAKLGSFYLQSKVHRAKEALEAVYQQETPGTSWNVVVIIIMVQSSTAEWILNLKSLASLSGQRWSMKQKLYIYSWAWCVTWSKSILNKGNGRGLDSEQLFWLLRFVTEMIVVEWINVFVLTFNLLLN